MASHSRSIIGGLAATAVLSFYFSNTKIPAFIVEQSRITRSGVLSVCLAALATQLICWAVMAWWKKRERGGAVYGLKHGRLHLQAQTAMWMNMGYWKDATVSTTLSEACRDLLSAVLAEAGFIRAEEEKEEAEEEEKDQEGSRRKKCLIDLGLGCGDQTIYLMSKKPVRPCDKPWWDAREHCARFDHYVGITQDAKQARYASERVAELLRLSGHETSEVALFCADAAKPTMWNEQLTESIRYSQSKTQESWVLALDTAYHFAPSRWEIIEYSHRHLAASFMAFDLCMSPTATFHQKLLLRIMTTLTRAPWRNFTTPAEYRTRLVQAGYQENRISIKDVSDNVFTPLAEFLERQNKELSVLGLGIGTLNIAKYMFAWWGRTGVVRGVIVTAKHGKTSPLS